MRLNTLPRKWDWCGFVREEGKDFGRRGKGLPPVPRKAGGDGDGDEGRESES